MDNVRSTVIVHLKRCKLRKPEKNPKKKINLLDAEAFAATAFAFHVGVAELERFVEAVLDEVDLGAIDELQAVGGHHDFDASLLEHDVVLRHAVGVVDRIGPTIAAASAHADTESHA